MHDVVLGLGANLGDPVAQLRRAVEALSATLDGLACSAVYRTEPVGFRDQPDFFNLVCAGRTALEPGALLDASQRLERDLGRIRTVRDGPRTLDVDLLDHGGRVVERPGLALPHPRLHRRAFVLVPLAELLPGWRHPRLGRTAAELLADLDATEGVRWWGTI